MRGNKEKYFVKDTRNPHKINDFRQGLPESDREFEFGSFCPLPCICGVGRGRAQAAFPVDPQASLL